LPDEADVVVRRTIHGTMKTAAIRRMLMGNLPVLTPLITISSSPTIYLILAGFSAVYFYPDGLT
jgi:hypothetical protein